MQFKYSKTILERYYIASFNKTLNFQKLLHIDSKCHWQLIQSSAPTAQTRLSMCCWQENNCVISCSEQEADRKKLPKTLATISFFRKEDSLIVNNWKLSIEKHTIVEDKLLLCSSPWNHTLLRVPLKIAHQVLLAITLYFYFLMLSHRMYIEY